jgi:hypothetical protein
MKKSLLTLFLVLYGAFLFAQSFYHGADYLLSFSYRIDLSGIR